MGHETNILCIRLLARRTAAGTKKFGSRWIIEQYVESIGVAYIIFQSVVFMENCNWSGVYILRGTFDGFGLHPDKSVQIVGMEGIGAFALQRVVRVLASIL